MSGTTAWSLVMADGIAGELDGVDLGDKRLNKRSQVLLECLAANPAASINAACDGWGDTQAAYRFLDNDAVTPELLLAPHIAATVRRMQAHPVVLVIQDTTELDYTAHPPQDARCLNRVERRGLYAHMHLAVSPQQLPLGVVGIQFFDRAPATLGKSDARSSLPIAEKESYRWLEGFRLANELATASGPRIVSVADREADIYDIYVDAQAQDGPRADYLVRARVERSTLERDPSAGAAAYGKVRAAVASQPVLAWRAIELAATPKRAARTARVAVRAGTVKPPHARSYLPAVTMNVVLAEEVDGPDDATTVSWLLFTSLPVDTAAAALLVVDYYAARWAIELYFKTLKTGCRVESIRLETLARLRRCLILYAIVAWRVQHLTYWQRTDPDEPCTRAFATREWQSVWLVTCETALPQTPPTLGELIRLLARLGGYNNRKGERPPGPQPIWVGLRRMTDFVIAYNALDEPPRTGCV
jgi:hypothetical protein